jgi:hypothetical protein
MLFIGTVEGVRRGVLIMLQVVLLSLLLTLLMLPTCHMQQPLQRERAVVPFCCMRRAACK